MAVGAWKGSGGVPAGGSDGQVLTRDGASGLAWETPAGTGDMLSTANLSDLANAATARTNLGVAIGTNVQAFNANLTTYATVAPTAAGLALLDDANAAAQRTTLGLGTAATSATGDFATPASVATAVSDHAALTETHGISAYGKTLVDDADAATARTTLGLGTAAVSATTDFQAADTTLDVLAAGTSGILELTGASTGTFRAAGAGAANSLIDRAAGDTRYPRVAETTIGASTNGDFGYRADLGLWQKQAAGAFADLAAPTATGEQLYDGTYAAASHSGRSRFVTTWGEWTINEWYFSDGTQWWPESRILRLGHLTESSTTSSTTNVVLATDAFPARMLQGAFLMELSSEFIMAGTTDTKTPKAWFGASGAGTGGTLLYNIASASSGLHATPRIRIYFDSNTAQHFLANTVNAQPNVSNGGARGTAAITVTSACEIAWGGLVANAADTMKTGHRSIEIHFHSRKT